MYADQRRHQTGLTLVELIIFIVIVSVAVVGILQVISLNTRNSADPARRKQAIAIAEGLIEEVRSASFSFCDINEPAPENINQASDCTKPEGVGPEATNTRPFDNVNDYVAAYGTAAAYSPDVAGTAFPGGYNATVTIVQDSTLGPAGATLPAGEVLRITVTVSYGADNVVLESYRTQYAPLSLPISPPTPL